ncbi:MAG TPA: alpha-L-fucosidase [Gemmatimonadales bacterium]|jgi:alpha-L-fucosidase
MFLHFGVNTFTDREWGDGHEDPAIFNPSALDARQWARTARAAGFKALILTAKHHDGFCLWPTRTTSHSVATSPFRGGSGDVVREMVGACQAEGLKAGLYCSPWDRNAASYGEARYIDFYIAQLTELLTNYGPIAEVWFDGANGEGPDGKHQVYDWPRFFGTVRRLQPDAVMFSDAGPDIRWIGNETGSAGETCWSTIDPAAIPYPGYDAPGVGEHLQRGDADGSVWRPGETDTSIRPGWFWHPADDARIRRGSTLNDLYLTSVGRNSKLLLNVPPNRAGLLSEEDISALNDFRDWRTNAFAQDLAAGARRSQRGSVLTIEMPRPVLFNAVSMAEEIQRGQAVAGYAIEAAQEASWRTIARGTTIGNRRIVRFDPVTSDRVRLTITEQIAVPHLSTVSLHAIP